MTSRRPSNDGGLRLRELGGYYDRVLPYHCDTAGCHGYDDHGLAGEYVWGFRVPLLVVSAYTPPHVSGPVSGQGDLPTRLSTDRYLYLPRLPRLWQHPQLHRMGVRATRAVPRRGVRHWGIQWPHLLLCGLLRPGWAKGGLPAPAHILAFGLLQLRDRVGLQPNFDPSGRSLWPPWEREARNPSCTALCSGSLAFCIGILTTLWW